MKTILLLLLTIPAFSQSVNDPDFCEKIKRKLPAISRVIFDRDQLSDENKQLIADKAEMHAITVNTVAKYDRALDSIALLDKQKDILWQMKLENAVKIEAIKNDKPIPWYKHPIFYGVLGFIGGVYLAK